MSPIQHVIRQAAKRWLFQRWINLSASSLLILLLSVVLLLTADRLFGFFLPLWFYLSLLSLAFLIAALIAKLQQPTPLQLAILLDHHLHLKDSLSTAYFLQHPSSSSSSPSSSATAPSQPLMDQILQSAQTQASSLTVSKAFPLRFSRIWAWVLSLLLLAIALYFFLPVDLLGYAHHRRTQQLLADQSLQSSLQAKENINHTLQSLEQLQSSSSTNTNADPSLAQTLAKLSELSRQDLSSSQSQKQALSQLTQAQNSLNQSIQQQEQSFSDMQSALSNLDPGQPGPADQFAAALRRSDFLAAAQAIENLAREIQSHQMTDADRQALQQQLQNLAQQLAQLAQQQQQAQQQQAQQQQQQPPSSSQQSASANPPSSSSTTQSSASASTQPSNSQQANSSSSQQSAQSSSNQSSSCNSSSSLQSLSQSLSKLSQSLSSSSSNQSSNQSSGQSSSSSSQSSSNQQQLSQSSNSLSQQLNQIAQMQHRLQQMQQAQSQLQQTMQSLSSSSSSASSQQQNSPSYFNQNQLLQSSPPGGHEAGTAPGDNPIGQSNAYSGYQTQYQHQPNENTSPDSPIIASWLSPGENAAGPITTPYNSAIQQAHQNAEQALTDDRVPQRYHQSIKDYFNQLPQSPQEIQKAPPKAPN